MQDKKLKLDFYQNNTELVAKSLLGKKLVRIIGKKRISGIITETEAYLGESDHACHSRNGIKTNRNSSMYLDGGHVYVYFIYGMYWCLNIVTKRKNQPEAVLIRSIEPIEGIDLMIKFRKQAKPDINNLTNGPGKLAMALKIDKKFNRIPLDGNKIFIEETSVIYNDNNIISSPRIGISTKNPAFNWPLRFYIKENNFVSKRKIEKTA